MQPKEGSGEGVVKLRSRAEFKRNDLIICTRDGM